MAQSITWSFFLIICSGTGCITVKSFFFHGVFFCCPRLGIETLPPEEGLTSHLPEVAGSLNSRGYFRPVAESSFPSASGFSYLCKKCEADPSCSVSCPFDNSQFYKV
ncbi:hypothetical protein NC651_039210 [Populus alba x Populus x berolinensis]|nr:hypothetical protein NC651_039210 [Populus alba x Populus x berolinensis]